MNNRLLSPTGALTNKGRASPFATREVESVTFCATAMPAAPAKANATLVKAIIFCMFVPSCLLRGTWLALTTHLTFRTAGESLATKRV
jgi:hypothetical protein